MLSHACKQQETLYKKDYTLEEKLFLSESLLNNAGNTSYYQGSVGERMVILEGNSLNPGNAHGQRELGVPYLKRGMAAEANRYYGEAIQADPEEWLGYKAYCWLYFYRDYKNVLEELDTYDAFTPDFVDYPQSTSVNYMRGICHLKLGDYDQAIHYLSMHLEKEIKDVGEQYIEPAHYVHMGIAYSNAKQFRQAEDLFKRALANHQNIAELHYYRAKNLSTMGLIKEAEASLLLAKDWFHKAGNLKRPYIEEFYAIYQEDLDAFNYNSNKSLGLQAK